ncbi:DNA-directed RNA polymerase subunit alpha [Candidatus Roizmanbacteria bacterium RIFOXYB2_FULL_38_10]|uniref:DNA-directed RNA polymerase subunit alpha n=1 Tax=Candidatus Roizmanbacteria bacterium RIFOXYD1_FULL_38_12 TaxID=1802093 RepID=A0A1F7L037_9BACT|nr:MAG: DNA-directed RNA polymerase subunit alpha [Candidatus Roizmanbacteria bacterium RIFOXYA2_FULL_38_14]OGK63411.1 MAG: DNA-directed RNA polymerase subunit alpha [Candidatus Roizmanbacteria bacterium RIFOXYA1_FULL_37_12]OGK65257.1 MAG: DNA-directed RNA polymerase subunit alpha [Candidatus Roizmanbacteria bacterium RIFOXYB1_FULL_40_23]OGK68810.1 MAG: DNA-directed RNA polymerase subunit alpha [Candidatus Roizmanbacteria bacterium RIFOXYB2_FULL_38_10]OGK69662.1 MAG: DNA-directed RNA polymerase
MLTPNFSTKKMQSTSDYEQFVLEPLAPSFGQTMGNSLRRTLLSSLKGAAIVGVKIDDVPHLFSSLKGVKETALEIVLNLKLIKFKLTGEGSFKVKISKKGIGKVYAKDIEGEAEVVSEDLYIAEITDAKGKLEIEAIVEEGYGYILAEEQQTKEFGYIAIDSSFSPVKKVNFKTEGARVGRKTNFDRLILDIWTDGSITPEEALKQSAKTLTTQFNHILTVESTTSGATPGEAKTSEVKAEIDKKFYDLIIDELNLPSRVVNALLRENIETVADLIKIGEDKLVVFKGLGKKSIELIKDELKKLGVQWS